MPSVVTDAELGLAEQSLFAFSRALAVRVQAEPEAVIGSQVRSLLARAAAALEQRLSGFTDEQLGRAVSGARDDARPYGMTAKEALLNMRDLALRDRYQDYEGVSGFSIDRLARVARDPLPVTLHVNPTLTDRATVSERLLKSGIRVKPIDWCPTGLQVTHVEGAESDAEFRSKALGRILKGGLKQSGHVYVLDKTSMLPPTMIDIQPGMTLLDMCASPGGKTVIASGRMENRGIIVANEPHPKRLRNLGENLERFQIPRLELSGEDGRSFGAEHPDRFDAVICDVPCSGTGMLRKKPFQIFSEDAASISGLPGLQLELLTSAFLSTKPGAQFCYSTCSLDVAENEAVAAAFLDRFGERVSVRSPHLAFPGCSAGMTHAIDTGIRDSAAVQERFLPEREPFEALRLWPHRHDCGGFFCVAFTKKRS